MRKSLASTPGASPVVWRNKSIPSGVCLECLKDDTVYADVPSETYDEYLVNLQAPAKDDEKEPPKFSIRCHDGFLKWLEPTDPDPREAGKPDAKKFTLAKRKFPR